jgi:spore coat protein U-like protein
LTKPPRPLPIRRLASAATRATIACAAFLAATPARADSCSVAAATLAFGNYDTINALDGTTTITVTCTHTNNAAVRFDYVVALSSGPGSYASRQMTGTGDTLIYNLYTSAARTTVWGDGSAGTATVAGSFNVGGGAGGTRWDTQNVYGRIGAAQNVLPGAYATAAPITVTITY